MFLSLPNLVFEQMLEINEERKPRDEAASTSAGQCVVKNEENVEDIKPTFKNEPKKVKIMLVSVADIARTTHSKNLIGLGPADRGAHNVKRARSESPDRIQESMMHHESKHVKVGQHESRSTVVLPQLASIP